MQPNYVGQFTQSEATAAQRTFTFFAPDVTDGFTAEATLDYENAASDVQVSKNGGAFANATGVVTEVANGIYQYVAAQAELDTIGTVVWKFVDAAARTVFAQAQVIADDLNVENTAALIADAVWDEATAGHVAAGSFGLMAAVTKGLAQGNVVIDGGAADVDGPTYDSAGMLTAGRIRVFASGALALAATAGAATGADSELAGFTIGASGSNGRFALYRVSEI